MKAKHAKRLSDAHKELGDALNEAGLTEQAPHHLTQWEYFKKHHAELEAAEAENDPKDDGA